MIIFLITLLIVLSAYYLKGKAVYLITYSIIVEGKREIYSSRYEVSIKHGLPSNEEFTRHIQKSLIEYNGLRIIDIHRLS